MAPVGWTTAASSSPSPSKSPATADPPHVYPTKGGSPGEPEGGSDGEGFSFGVPVGDSFGAAGGPDATGCHAGCRSFEGSCVRRRAPVPSAFITKMSSFPSRLLTNTICWPSGDHCGWLFLTGPPVVRSLNAPPFALITATPILGLRARDGMVTVTAICLPFGDHDGVEASSVAVERSRLPVPSGFVTSICDEKNVRQSWPLTGGQGTGTLTAKAIDRPSGDHVGADSDLTA